MIDRSEFDFTDLREKRRASARRTVSALVLLALLLGGLGAYGLSLATSPTRSWLVWTLVPSSALGVILAGLLVVIVVFLLRPIPTRLVVSDGGLSLQYVARPTRSIRWTDPKLRLYLSRSAEQPGGREPSFGLRVLGIGTCPLTPEAFAQLEEVLRSPGTGLMVEKLRRTLGVERLMVKPGRSS
jgi:hypothetical protein